MREGPTLHWRTHPLHSYYCWSTIARTLPPSPTLTVRLWLLSLTLPKELITRPLLCSAWSFLFCILPWPPLYTHEATLLLYLLLHRNKGFHSFVLASTEIDLLVIPILQTLYRAPDCSNHHIYMSLIILLILSEDDLFNQTVHSCILKQSQVAWYTERAVTELSLGGLLILVVIRTIQYNMLKMRQVPSHELFGCPGQYECSISRATSLCSSADRVFVRDSIEEAL